MPEKPITPRRIENDFRNNDSDYRHFATTIDLIEEEKNETDYPRTRLAHTRSAKHQSRKRAELRRLSCARCTRFTLESILLSSSRFIISIGAYKCRPAEFSPSATRRRRHSRVVPDNRPCAAHAYHSSTMCGRCVARGGAFVRRKATSSSSSSQSRRRRGAAERERETMAARRSSVSATSTTSSYRTNCPATTSDARALLAQM